MNIHIHEKRLYQLLRDRRRAPGGVRKTEPQPPPPPQKAEK